MKIAILSDIHANDIALKAVLKETDDLNIDKILFLGDYVGYYYNADVIFKLIKNYDKEMVKGNHEILLEESLKNRKRALEIKMKYGSGIEYAKKLLSVREIDYLINLPDKNLLEFKGIKILICHGSPWDKGKYIYPDSPDELKNRALGYEADFVFIGHTHYPFIYEYNNKTLINPGSVGQNRKTGGVANWAFLDLEKNRYMIKKTYYDKEKLLEQVKRIDFDNKYLVDVLNRE
ncbi:metallophosphoesterase family protein [Natroniella sp. ANB-PHB2]|uniref:metallophosphoesterase family protein n=1 Tax=Natroniella sp. ANB-PHB2 TaxID=3384444 RepID=UPI0038D396BA